MKDRNGVEIKKGDYIKRVGLVTYADGQKEKISKKTWLVGEANGELVFPPKAEGIDFLIVGNEVEGFKPEYSPVIDLISISEGYVAGNYRVLKEIESKDWKAGDIVKIHGKVSKETLEGGFLEKVSDELQNKHLLIVVDPITTGLLANQPQ